MEIKKIDEIYMAYAIDLIWSTFLQFEAPDYSEEGIQSFKDFNDNRKHICCFFVKAQYHRQGIGRKLWEYLCENSQSKIITVNSSPYAVPIYHKLGFVDLDIEQVSDGMRYTPMKYER